MKIPFATFKPMHDEIRKDLDQAYNKVIDSNYFIQGKECELFEKEFADYCNAKYCVGVATGLDALYLILRAMNIGNGDEVIVPSNTYIATALAVSYCGATPIFVEPELETYNINPALIEEKITDQTMPEQVCCYSGAGSVGVEGGCDEEETVRKKRKL